MAVNPPRPSLPSLNALRAFESAARLGGFKQAAAELNVSAGAVAQHVKTLEGWCGGALFLRHAKGVSLSSLGHQVLPEFTAAFDGISAASQRLRSLAAPKSLNIATLPSVAQLLLAEWMPELRRAVPDARISVTAMESPPNLAREPFDLSIFFGAAAQDEGAILLAGPDHLLPVCAPALAQDVTGFEELMALPHISDQFWPNDWAHWAKAAFPDHSYCGTGPNYSLYSVAVREAVNGGGVLMGHQTLVAPLLARGELVPVLPVKVPLALNLTLWRSPVLAQSGLLDQLVARIRELAMRG